MYKKDKSKGNEKNDLQNSIYHPLVWILRIFSVIIIAILIGDMFNLADTLNIRLRFDWAMIICTFVSAIAAICLGIVSIEQNKQLAEINDAQLESSIVAQNYPLIKFCKEQIIKIDNNIFELKFYDMRNTPLKEIYIKNMALIPYSEMYKVDGVSGPIWIQKEKKKFQVEFTPYCEKNSESEGFYFADIYSDLEIFQAHKYYRIEFDLDAVSTSGVVTTYKYKLLIERADGINPLKNRRYPKVYHQFYEFGDIMSINKYSRQK